MQLLFSKNSLVEFRANLLPTLIRFSVKVEIFLEQREVAFLPPSKICENFNFSTEIQIFANFAG